MTKVTGRRGRRLAGSVACALAASAMVAGSASAWTATLSGADQTASHIPGDPDGSGSATVTPNAAGTQICATVYFSNIAQPVVAGHVHEGAYGQPENPAFTINLFGPNLGGTGSPVSGCTVATPAQVLAIDSNPWMFNVVVHNQQYPAGAIRGQLTGGTALCHKIDESLCVGAGQ